ncbi:MAG: glycosyltransferase family 39 protein [Kovacikia sp.]
MDFKPLWLDEVITALFSLGRGFDAVPLDQAFPLSRLTQLFTLKPETSCAQIVATVATQSVHPPLFFCWMHDWLVWIDGFSASGVWKLRSLPALLGVVAIVAVYQLNRIAFSPQAGLMGAALMAVSPFAVYLSQEARHYTLPMLLLLLALMGLHQLHSDLYQQRFRPGIWLGWIAVNSLGFYVHYFFLLAVVAQVVTLVVNFLSFKYLPSLHPAPNTLNPFRSLAAIALAVTGVCLTYLPWLPTLLNHFNRPETDWLKLQDSNWLNAIAPLYQMPLGWMLMVVALPVEQQPVWIAILSGGLMLLFIGWLGWQLSGRFTNLWSTPESHLATRMLVIFVLVVLLEFLGIIYLLGKDITLVPRYNFIYFPAVCALLGASLVQADGRQKVDSKLSLVRPSARRTAQRNPGRRERAIQIRGYAVPGTQRRKRINLKLKIQNSKFSLLSNPHSPIAYFFPGNVVFWVLLIGFISSGFVVSNQVFQKPYYPDMVAKNMRIEPEVPLLVGMGYSDFQDVALGLSFGLALRDQNPVQKNKKQADSFAFLGRSPGYEQVLQKLAHLKYPVSLPLNLWLIAPGLRRVEYPANLVLATGSKQEKCAIDSTQYHRLGIPYQMYHCGKIGAAEKDSR